MNITDYYFYGGPELGSFVKKIEKEANIVLNITGESPTYLYNISIENNKYKFNCENYGSRAGTYAIDTQSFIDMYGVQILESFINKSIQTSYSII